MHIPDGYLGPPTFSFFYAVMLPIWIGVSKYLKKKLEVKQVPYLAVSAAFSFVIMMFNVPIPGGSTGHAVGAVLVSIILGPAAACMAVTVALLIQALLFGDGGITTFAANCFNMAFIMPFTGYFIYKFLVNNVFKKKYALSAGVASYLGLNLAALFTALEFGIQPVLHKNIVGNAVYCPYGLNVAIPVMMLEHLLLFGVVEAVVSAAVVKYLRKQNQELFLKENFNEINK